ncbi:hypothetical protein [Ramlibacter albus]|uniref:Uncharacterized protein n=1 Tax=Ramlibacter albus TaxID=2079448 RepID=A0A923M6L6_9BURK|nr:hypothetical protein [Ramlibacter albus]MBC5765192.1 hypothetical protein [Ramlibacter albus]
MKTTDARSRKSLISFSAIALLALGAATAQVAIGADTTHPGTSIIDNSGSYSHEVQACLSGKTQQSQADCLKEARNAQGDKRRGQLEDYAKNTMARCDALQGEDRASCQARMMGYGSIDGSVAGGGLVREVETVTLPAGAHEVTVEPRTQDPVVLLPQ